MSRIYGLIALFGILAAGIAGCSAPAEGDPTASGTSTSATGTSESTGGAATDAFVTNAVPVIAKNCLGCHSGPGAKKGIDMAKFATEADAKANLDTIHKMAEEVEGKKMPPPNGPVMSDEDRAKLVAALKAVG